MGTGADDLASCRVLVVGGAGFVGSNLVTMLLAEPLREIVVVDNLLSSERENIPDAPRVQFVQGSIADDAVLGSLGSDFDFVFHLATYHGNQNSIADPLADHDNNLITTLKLYEQLKRWPRLRRVVYAASGCVLAPHTFDDPTPVEEGGPVPFELDSPYQISKVVGEFYSVYYHRRENVPTVRARFQNVYGPGEILGAGRWRGTPATIWRNVTPGFVYRSLKGLPLTLDGDGVATRDFIYVEDIARGLILCATRGAPGDVYNLATGKETSILELADTINRISGNPTPHEILPRRAWDHAGRRLGSTAKAERVLGFRAETSLEQGLRRTVSWTREHLDLIERCIHQHRSHVAS